MSDGVIAGCNVTWDNGTTVFVSAGSTTYGGVVFNIPSTSIVLDGPPDPPSDGVGAVWRRDTIEVPFTGTAPNAIYSPDSYPTSGNHLLATASVSSDGDVIVVDGRTVVQPPLGRIFFVDFMVLNGGSDVVVDGSGVDLSAGGYNIYLGTQSDPDELGIWSQPTSGAPWVKADVQPDQEGDIIRGGTGPYQPYASVWIRTSAGMDTADLDDLFDTINSSQINSDGVVVADSGSYPKLSDMLDGLWSGVGVIPVDGHEADWDDDPPTSLQEVVRRIAAHIGPIPS